jgi:sugar phosphate isomerase/epimerase
MKKQIIGQGIVLMAAVAVLMTAGVCVAADAPAKGPGAPNAEKLGWRLACQAYSFNHFTFFEAVDKTASLGLKYIEAYPGQKLSPDKPDVKFDHDMSAETQAAVNAKLNAAGIKLVNYGVVALGSNEADCRKVFDFAKKMGIETIVSEPPKAAMPLVDKLAQEYGINVAIHNHPKPSLYWNYENLLEAAQGRSKRIGSCADTGHWMRSGINPLEALKKLESRIISFHFKDLNEFGNMAAHDVAWGTGKADVRALLTEMKRQGFKGVFSIEYEHNWDNSVPEIAECVKYFDQVAAELAK